MNQKMQVARTSPTELEMHRMAHNACKSSGWESAEEILSAHGTLQRRYDDLIKHCEKLEAQLGQALARESAHAQDVKEMGGMLAAWKNEL